MTSDTLFTLANIYLNLNIILVISFLVWSAIPTLSKAFGVKNCSVAKLKLINITFLSIIISPILIGLVISFFPNKPMTFSDIIISQYLSGNIDMSATNVEGILGVHETIVRQFINQCGIIPQIALGILILGFIFFTVEGLISWHKLRKILNNSFNWHDFGTIKVLLSDDVTVPFSTRGLYRKYIVFPTDMLENMQDVRIALSHELQHFRQKDVEWEYLYAILKPLFFWNPVFYLWKEQITQLRELACDQTIMSRTTYDARSYCECLMRAFQRNIRSKENGNNAHLAVSFVGSDRKLFKPKTSLLKQRILAVSETSTSETSALVFGMMSVPLVLTVLVTVLMLQAPPDWSQDRLMLSTIVNLEQLDAMNTQSR